MERRWRNAARARYGERVMRARAVNVRVGALLQPRTLRLFMPRTVLRLSYVVLFCYFARRYEMARVARESVCRYVQMRQRRRAV